MANVFKIQEDHKTAGQENERAERRLAVDAGPEPILNIVAISAFATRGPLIFLPAKHHTAFTALSWFDFFPQKIYFFFPYSTLLWQFPRQLPHECFLMLIHSWGCYTNGKLSPLPQPFPSLRDEHCCRPYHTNRGDLPVLAKRTNWKTDYTFHFTQCFGFEPLLTSKRLQIYDHMPAVQSYRTQFHKYDLTVPLPTTLLYEEYLTFHAKYEGVLHLMLIKCICFSSFGWLQCQLWKFSHMTFGGINADCCLVADTKKDFK